MKDYLLKKDMNTICESAQRYRVKKLMLFGSMLSRQSANDIDLAVSGLSGRSFFQFHADLDGTLSLPVDMIDLDVKSPFVDLVEITGKVIYDVDKR